MNDIWVSVDYLGPFVVLCIVGLDGVQIWLAVVSTHGVQPVTQQANTHRIPGNAEGRHSGPRIRLWVIPVDSNIWSDDWFCTWWDGKKVKIVHPISPNLKRGQSVPSPLIETSLCSPPFNHWCLNSEYFQHGRRAKLKLKREKTSSWMAAGVQGEPDSSVRTEVAEGRLFFFSPPWWARKLGENEAIYIYF